MKINIPNISFQPTPRIAWLTVVFILFFTTFLAAQTTKTFDTNGTFTVPPGVNSITVEAWGAGGGGGSALNNFTFSGGGGGGAFAKSNVSVTPGSTYNVIVGVGGSADNNGGNSTFNVNTVIAAGGFGGSSSSTGGSGGSIAASIGTIRYAGGNGGNAISGNSGGGGGGAGSNGSGGNASGITPGAGNSLNGGNGGDGVSSSLNGNNGFNYGGGGSGALRSRGPSRTGGNGANGLVVISWVAGPFLSITPTTLNLGYVANGETSSSLTYALSGSNLSGAPGNITVTTPANFEVSLAAGSGYATSISVPYSSSTLASTTIYVRFKPTASNIDYTGTITNSGGGSATVNVAVTGTSKVKYCDSSGHLTYQTSITNVQFNTIDNASAKPAGYSDYTALVTNVNIGSTYDLSVRVNTAGNYTNYTYAWVDWNKDGDFLDPGEAFDLGSATNTTNGLTNLSPRSITIPSGAALGDTRIRVATKYNVSPISCEPTTFDGEVEDYTINILPCIPPTITNTAPASRCGTGTVNLGATASAGTINWYTASTGGASIGTGTSFTTPSISVTTTYWVDASANSCTTNSRTAVTATVNTIPTITGISPASRCGTGTVNLGATASAGTINWYAASSGGSSLGTGTSFITPSISSTTTYWVDATLNGCITATRTAVTATVNATPSATAGSAIAVCTGLTAITMTGATSGGTNSGNSWSGGDGFGTWSQNANPALATFTPTTSSGSITATLTVTGSGSCLGTNPTATRTITWETTPTITGASPASRCGIGTVNLGATASAGTINWYAASSGGSSLGTGTSFITPSISSTTTYWVDATLNGCTTPSRTAVTATVNAIPSITGTSPASRCGTGTVTLGATASAGTINWYATSSGGSSLGTGTSFTTPSISVTTTYWVDASANSCTTSSRTAVTATVNSIPISPSTTGSYICIGSTATLFATGAVSGDRYLWYTASSGGTLIKTSTNNTDNTFITPIISTTTNYWVAILNSNGCESARTQVTATFPATSADNQNLAGINNWEGHVFKRLDAVAQPPTDVNAYTNYYGRITEVETFNDSFGGATVCLPLTASESPRSIYTEYFAIKFLMTSDKKGIYLADIGSDDGARLTVDGVKIYDQWVQRAYINNTKILFQLSGSSNLMLEYFESAGGNQVSFQNLTKVPNNLNSGTSQTICSGGTLIAITANNVLADSPISSTAGFSVAYQWQQSSNIAGPFSDISGATSQDYTPTVSIPGTYYFKRKITVTKTNLGSIVVNALDFSSVAQIVITPVANIDSVTGANTLCVGDSTTYLATNVVLGGGSGSWSSNNTAVATVNSAGLVTTFSPGTATISYTITGGCGGTKTATIQLTVLSTTIATPDTITGIVSQCPSSTDQVYTIASVTNATTYTWSVPTGWSITAGDGTTTVTVTTGTVGQNGNISVTAGNSCGTSAAKTLAVVVNSCINKWKGSVSSDWNTSGNWTQNFVPAIDADIIFDDSPENHCVLDQNRSVTDITNTQGTYRMVLNGYQLTIKGTMIFSGGALIDPTANNSTLVFAGTELQSLNAAQLLNANVYNLTINNANNVRLSGTLNLLNSLTAISGRLDAFTNSATLVYTGTATQNIIANTLLDDKIHHLTIDNTAGVNLNTNLTVVQNLTINISKSLLVASNVQFTALGTITNNGGNSGLVLKSDTNGTASLLHNTNNVPVTVHRYISRNAEDWHFLSSPVSNQEISGTWLPAGSYGTGNPLTGTGYDLYVWNEETFCWIYKSDTSNWNLTHPTTNFVPGRGYLYSVQATKPTKTFEGSLNNGIYNYPLTRSITTDVSLKELEGFNLVGNPYPSSIDWSALSGWTRTDLAESGGGRDMWIWNPEENNYGVYNSNTQIGTNSITRYIAPMQGYFVKATNAGNLGFDNTVRVHTGAGNWFKPSGSKSHLIRVNVQSEAGNGGDEVLLQFGIPKNQWGASKIFSHVKTAPSLYFNTVKEAYSVQYLSNTTENISVPVAFMAGVNGNYMLTLNFNPDEFELILLEDKHSKSVQIMNSDEQYQFKANTNDSANRFVIHFTEIKNNDTSFPAKLYTDGQLLYVDLSAIETSSELMVYDMLGKLLLKTTLQGNTLHTLPVSHTAQILMVRLQNQEGVLSRKLLFYKL